MLVEDSEKIRREQVLLTIWSGLKTLTADIPMLDFAMPYAAPIQQSMMLMLPPIAPKNDCLYKQMGDIGGDMERRSICVQRGKLTAYTGLRNC